MFAFEIARCMDSSKVAVRTARSIVPPAPPAAATRTAELPMRYEWDPPTTYRDRVRSRLIPGKIEEEVRRQPGMAFYYALVNNALCKRLYIQWSGGHTC